MIDTFVVTLREGVEAALVIAIAVSYVKRIGRLDLMPAIYRGLLTAVVASFIVAWGFNRIGGEPDAYEGWVLLISAVFVLSMVIWMNRHGAHMKTEIETGLQKGSSSGSAAWGVFTFVFLMIFREGVETVLLLAALRFDTSGVLGWLGGALGIALALLFGVAFIRGTFRVNLKQFFRITTAILVVVVIQLTLTGLHELSESQILPSSSSEMAVLGPIVNNEVFFIVTILALAAAMVLFESRGRRAQKMEGLEGAALRKARWSEKREKVWMIASCAASCIFMLMITAEYVYARQETALSAPTQVNFENAAIRIPVASVSDGTLHRFMVDDQGVHVRFIVIEKADHKLAVAFDACSICGSKGFYQKGDEVICKLCGSEIVITSIGQRGGCNPIPLKSHIESSANQGDALVIEEAAFEPGPVAKFRS
jgi:FTR1 family protein